MKKTLLIALLWLFAITPAWSETITLAVGDWAPYTSKENADARVAQTLVTEAFAQVNIEVVYAYVPWKRAFNKTLDGKYDGTFPWYRTPEREADFIFPDIPLLRDSFVFFHLKDKTVQWDSWDDLKTFKIGVMASDFTETLLKEKGLKVEAIQESDANFKKILAKRIDIYPTSLLVGYHSIHNLFPADKAALFTNNPKPLKEDDMFIMFSKQAGPRFLELFVDGLRKLKASGRYDAIMNEVTSGK